MPGCIDRCSTRPAYAAALARPMTRAARAAMDFVTALDTGRLGRLLGCCAPAATWWVGTGPDRPGGEPAVSPAGSGRFPLHGLMGLADKLDLMRDLGPQAFPTGCRQIPRRVIAGDLDCVIEVEGFGVHASGATYANRYGFVFDVDRRGLITSVREYLDTIHAQQVVGAGTPLPPSATLDGGDRRPALAARATRSPAAQRALALWPALARGDLDGFAEQFHPDAHFWTDSGRDRVRGRLDGRGDARANGPFHGRVPIADKLAVMRERIRAAGYTTPGITVTPHRLIADGNLVAIEASGDARLGEHAYQNRYLWVIDADAAGIREVREYCDTLHLAVLHGARGEYAD